MKQPTNKITELNKNKVCCFSKASITLFCSHFNADNNSQRESLMNSYKKIICGIESDKIIPRLVDHCNHTLFIHQLHFKFLSNIYEKGTCTSFNTCLSFDQLTNVVV